jgi:hypothetical protein
MCEFTGPRDESKATSVKPAAQKTWDPKELAELHRLCRDGRLYDIERWIQARRPLQAISGGATGQRRVASAFEIALEVANQALVVLLLCNGYDPNLGSTALSTLLFAPGDGICSTCCWDFCGGPGEPLSPKAVQ